MGYTLDGYYPPTGFSFIVYFDGVSSNVFDVRFQEVSTIAAEIEVEPLRVGGDARTFYKPVARRYPPLILRRGLLSYSGLYDWFERAIEDYDIDPVTVTVCLLDAGLLPVAVWVFNEAWPTRWEVSGLNAENAQIVAESITLVYSNFTRYDGIPF